MQLADRSYELRLSCSAVRSSCFANDENDFALSCISEVRMLIPCQIQRYVTKKKKNWITKY